MEGTRVTLLYYHPSERRVVWTIYDGGGKAVSSGSCSGVAGIDLRGKARISAGIGGWLVTVVYEGDRADCSGGIVFLGKDGVDHGKSSSAGRKE